MNIEWEPATGSMSLSELVQLFAENDWKWLRFQSNRPPMFFVPDEEEFLSTFQRLSKSIEEPGDTVKTGRLLMRRIDENRFEVTMDDRHHDVPFRFYGHIKP